MRGVVVGHLEIGAGGARKFGDGREPEPFWEAGVHRFHFGFESNWWEVNTLQYLLARAYSPIARCVNYLSICVYMCRVYRVRTN